MLEPTKSDIAMTEPTKSSNHLVSVTKEEKNGRTFLGCMPLRKGALTTLSCNIALQMLLMFGMIYVVSIFQNPTKEKAHNIVNSRIGKTLELESDTDVNKVASAVLTYGYITIAALIIRIISSSVGIFSIVKHLVRVYRLWTIVDVCLLAATWLEIIIFSALGRRDIIQIVSAISSSAVVLVCWYYRRVMRS